MRRGRCKCWRGINRPGEKSRTIWEGAEGRHQNGSLPATSNIASPIVVKHELTVALLKRRVEDRFLDDDGLHWSSDPVSGELGAGSQESADYHRWRSVRPSRSDQKQRRASGEFHSQKTIPTVKLPKVSLINRTFGGGAVPPSRGLLAQTVRWAAGWGLAHR